MEHDTAKMNIIILSIIKHNSIEILKTKIRTDNGPKVCTPYI